MVMELNNPLWGELSYLSASRINAFIRCGVKFKLEYVHKLRAPGNINMHRGSGLHAAIEADNKLFMESGNRLDLSDLIGIGNKCFDEKIYDEGVFIPAKDIEKKDKIISKARQEMESAIKLYHEMEKPWVPVLIEESLMEDIGYPLKMNCRMDMVDENSCIYDWKTSGKNVSRILGIQDLIYSKVYECKYGVKPTFNYVNFILTKTPVIVIQTMPQPKNYDMLDRYLELYFNAIENGIYLPASDTDYLCGESSCPFYLNCEFKENS